ncbi:MAG: hypothetical protein MJ173_09930 [Clostridia bacterium]|nr:hypothetical protein [Clostridia bacterium]
MADDLFRKKSLDKIKSPDQLNDYVRVANPGVWLLLCAVVVLLIGFCVWGIFGQIKTTVPAQITVDSGKIICAVDGDIDKIEVGMTVEAGDTNGVVKLVDTESDLVEIDISLSDGVYEGEIVTESIAPLSFVFN